MRHECAGYALSSWVEVRVWFLLALTLGGLVPLGVGMGLYKDELLAFGGGALSAAWLLICFDTRRVQKGDAETPSCSDGSDGEPKKTSF